MGMTTASIRLPRELKARYGVLAEATGRTKNYLMTEALEQYVERELQHYILPEEISAQPEGSSVSTEGYAHDVPEAHDVPAAPGLAISGMQPPT